VKYRVVELLADPVTAAPLRVANATSTEGAPVPQTTVRCSRFCAWKNAPIAAARVTPKDCSACYGIEVNEGELVADTGSRYPIVGGIPRLFSEQTRGWLKKNQETFSLEWKMFRFGERNWGQSIEFRRELFLRAWGLTRDELPELKGKLILDAGCGSGLLSMNMADHFGMEVVAMDLAFGIEQAYRKNTNPYVYYLQGSVLEPPLRRATFEMVYCAGVLVALPDTRNGFRVLTPLLAPGGRCFIWVYHPIDARHHPRDRRKMALYNWIRVNVTSRLPIRLQRMIYSTWIPPYLVKRSISNLFARERDERTVRERMQDWVDMFSPLYQNRHTEEEVLEWFRAEGFEAEAISYTEDYGFGARGTWPSRVKMTTANAG
jgi:ubiquinone/menaquinone biosynthesis C-methylase UbiE/uncharacterized protein YbaR (Trm112 family)